MKSIGNSLGNALRIAPRDPEVTEERDKFELARKHITEEHVRRCPFCWSPLGHRTVACHYCGGHRFVTRSLFTGERSVKHDILINAIQRYRNVEDIDKNVFANYYLGMAYLNLENWEKALSQLDKSAKLAPENENVANQLRLLLDYMASSETELEAKPPEAEGEFDPNLSVEDEGKSKRILVVEDSSTTRKVITITLVRNNYEVIEARDGLEALSRVNEKRPDLILLDILLPKMDGYKILSIIKNSPQLKNIPVIMLTSKHGIVDKVKGKLGGSAAYLTKPFDPEQLLKTVERYL
jgi:twitching motility two-component system response regulator PilG